VDQVFGAIAANGDTFGIGVMLVGTLGYFLRQLATGNLVFRKSVDSEIARTVEYYDKVIALKDQQVQSWHTAFQNEQIARTDQGATLAELSELSRAADHMLRALPTSRTGGAVTGGGEE
jgi:hypothetical protein